jgi:hypothetical protein
LLAQKDDTVVENIEPEYSYKSVGFGDLNGYAVIYPNGNEQLRQAAQKLVSYFSKYGIAVTISSDSAAKTDKEILLGNTNRKKSLLAEN